MKTEIKVILIVLILLGLSGGYLALNKKIIPVDSNGVPLETELPQVTPSVTTQTTKKNTVQTTSNNLTENGMTQAEQARLWADYGEQERKKAGYPPTQSPQIDYDLATSRAEGEVYFDAHNQNYAGVCSSLKMVGIKNSIISLGDFTVTCKDKETAWAMSVILNSNTLRYWCADSQGNTAEWKEKPVAWNGKTANVSIITSCLD